MNLAEALAQLIGLDHHLIRLVHRSPPSFFLLAHQAFTSAPCKQYSRQPGVVSVAQGRIQRAYSEGREPEGEGLQLQQIQRAGLDRGLGAALDSELTVDVLDVFLHGPHRDHQLVGNLLV